MLVGIETFENARTSTFDENLASSHNYIKCDNMILDEIICDNNADEMVYDLDKKVWDEYTEFLARFQGDLEAGNIKGVGGEYPTHIVFKKRLKGKSDWVVIAIREYNRHKRNEYIIFDYLAFSGEEYEYAVFPAIYNPETDTYKEGEPTINSITPFFVGIFICDLNKSVQIKYEPEVNNKRYNRLESTLQPLGRQFPIVQRVGNVRYSNGQMSFMLLSENTINNVHGVDTLEDTKYANEVVDWIDDGNAKIVKDGNSRKDMMYINNVQLDGDDKFEGGLPTISFQWMEIGSVFSQKDMSDNGFAIEYNVEK